MRKIRVGVIGQGRSGYDIHVHNIGLLPEQFELGAVADPIKDRCREAVEKHGATAYQNYREMLKQRDLDLIVNSTPSHLHVPVSLEILDAGYHVLCEKPLARRASQVDQLVNRAKKKGKLLAIYQQSRYAPYFRQVKKLIDAGVLGRIVMIKIAFNGFGRRWDWQTLQEYDGGNLLNTGPHPLDQALQLFGTDTMPKVHCLMDRALTYGDAEDHVKLILSGKGRPTIDLEISSCAAYPSSTYQVYGTLGGLTGSTTHLEWKYFDPKAAPPHTLTREPLPGRVYCRDDLSWKTESWDVPSEQSNLFDTMGVSFYRNLYDALTRGMPLEVRPEHVRQQIAVIEECHRQNPLSRLAG